MASNADPTISSRRKLLAGLLGGFAATAAGALGRPQPVKAGQGDVHLGTNNPATSQTTITNTEGGHAFAGVATSATALTGTATTGTGVYAYASAGIGIYARSDSPTHAAVYAISSGNRTGLRGVSGGISEFASPAKTGVYGYAVQDSGSRGVTGQTTVGRGVYGIATTGIGVSATAGAAGTAFHAQGRVAFSTSGLATVAVGTKSKTITAGSNLLAGSKILCTVETNQAGLFLHRVTKDTAANTFKAVLSANVLAGKYAKVAWFVIG